jgi:hypothetical protein
VIGRVVNHHVLDQVHVARVQSAREVLVIGERAEMRIDLREVRSPIAVVAAVAHALVPPLVAHRWRDPERRRADLAQVVEAARQALQVAAAVARAILRGVLARALVVVARVAVIEAVDHREVDDLLAPVGRGQVQRAGAMAGIGMRPRQPEAGGQRGHQGEAMHRFLR